VTHSVCSTRSGSPAEAAARSPRSRRLFARGSSLSLCAAPVGAALAHGLRTNTTLPRMRARYECRGPPHEYVERPGACSPGGSGWMRDRRQDRRSGADPRPWGRLQERVPACQAKQSCSPPRAPDCQVAERAGRRRSRFESGRSRPVKEAECASFSLPARPGSRAELRSLHGCEGELDRFVEVERRSFLCEAAVDAVAEHRPDSRGGPVENRGFERLVHVADISAPFLRCP
jgi:hypothetical protein